jgi:hypothetical protein
MPVIKFSEARQMATDADKWMQEVSAYIKNPENPAPKDLFPTQKLAFKIEKKELASILEDGCDSIVGILGYEKDISSLTVIFVGTDKDGKLVPAIEPRETWPPLNKMDELNEVLKKYLTP